MIENKNEINNLTSIRDELIQLLMNGQVSINYDFSLKLYDAICFSVILKKEILHERIINQFNS
jgi:hypothetical protein